MGSSLTKRSRISVFPADKLDPHQPIKKKKRSNRKRRKAISEKHFEEVWNKNFTRQIRQDKYGAITMFVCTDYCGDELTGENRNSSIKRKTSHQSTQTPLPGVLQPQRYKQITCKVHAMSDLYHVEKDPNLHPHIN